MIYIIEGFNTKLECNDSIYNIFSYNRVSIKPCERKIIQLPLRIVNPTKKYISFEIDKKLALNGIQCIWSNINDETSLLSVELLVFNSNLDYESLYKVTGLSSIIGSNNKIDIQTETLLGKIYIN